MRLSRTIRKCLHLGVFLLIHVLCLLLISVQTYITWRSSEKCPEDQTNTMKQVVKPKPVPGQFKASGHWAINDIRIATASISLNNIQKLIDDQATNDIPKSIEDFAIKEKLKRVNKKINNTILKTTTGPTRSNRKITDGPAIQNISKTTTGHENPQKSINQDVKAKLEIMEKEMNASRVTSDAVYPAKRIGKYLLLNPRLCSGVALLDIIIIVHTAPGNLERRQRIRDSFGHEPSFLPFHVRVAFMLGKTMNGTLEKQLQSEHIAHKDTVMGDFIDDYHNLTIKGAMGFRWVSEYCANSKFVLKIDDDVMINMYKLLYSFLNYMSGKVKSIFCNLWHRDRSQILRDGKWKVDPHIFARRQTYPYDYCSGFSVILTSDLMKPMFEAANTSPFFWIDDVYLFGMLPIIVGQVTYYNFAMDKNITKNEELAINCTRSQGPRCPIYANLISDESFWPFWKMIQDIYTTSSWHLENKTVS